MVGLTSHRDHEAVVESRHRWQTASLLALVAVASVPVAIGVVRFAGRSVTLTGDNALMWMRIGDVLRGRLPTTGLYSRYGWNHPGPALFYLLAPVRAVTLGADWGAVVAASMWSGGCLALTAWLALRRGGLGLVAAALAAEVGVWVSVGGDATIVIWPPVLTASLVVPFLLAVWGVARCDGMGLVASVVLGSVLVQAHVGYVGLVLAVLAVATVAAARRREGRFGRRAVAVAGAAGAVMWLPVAIDTIVHRPSNLQRIVDFFRHGGAAAGVSAGLRMLAVEFKPIPPWLRGPEPTIVGGAVEGAAPAWLLVPAVLSVVGVVAARRGGAGLRALMAVVIVALIVGAASLAQIRDAPYPYLTYWRAGLATVLVAACGIAVVRRGWRERPRLPEKPGLPGLTGRPVAVTVACVWLAVGALVAGVAVARVHAATPDGDAVAEVVSQVRRGPRPSGLVLLRFADPAFTGVLDTVLADLENRHVPVRVDATLGFMFGPWRTTPPNEAGEIWYVTENGASYALLASSPGARLVAHSSPLDDTSDAQLSRLQVMLAAQLREAGHPELAGALDSELADFVLANVPGIDQAAVAAVAQLNRRRRHGPRFGVIAFPADQPPDQWWSTA